MSRGAIALTIWINGEVFEGQHHWLAARARPECAAGQENFGGYLWRPFNGGTGA
jgi:hypothetical protein